MIYKNTLFCFVFILLFNCTSKKQEPKSEEQTVVTSIQKEDTNSFDEFDNLIKQYESEDRDVWQQPEVILRSLGDLKGKTVADIGAGTGYFSFKLAKQADTVYAVDIDKRFLDYIEERKEGLRYDIGQNVVTKLTSPDDPGLSSKTMDLILLVNTYSYINNRIQYFEKVKKVLKPKGHLFIVDFKERNTPVGPPKNIRVSYKTAEGELKKAGFRAFKVDSTSLPYQYILKAS